MKKEELIAQLRELKIKHNPDAILRIARIPEGKIVFIEVGDLKSGWLHIKSQHGIDFANRGITEEQILDVIMIALTEGKIIGTQGTTRRIYEIEFNQITQYISIDLGSNGYIVGANPTKSKLIRHFKEEI